MILAKTWNGNESGTLWEAYWCYDEKIGYYMDSHGPGFDNPRQLFSSEKDFWLAYRADKKEFNGKLAAPKSNVGDDGAGK